MTTCATLEPASSWTSFSPRLPKTWASKFGRFSSCPTAKETAASKWGHTAAIRCASASISGTGFKLNVEATFNISTPAKTSKCVLHKRHGNAIVSPPEAMTDLTCNCAGMPRRDFLQLGIGAVLGLGLSDILCLRANAASSPLASKSAGKQVNCIMIWMDGGPSHYETFDPKPDAPAEIRGTFKTIPTCVPGVNFSEPVPELAKAFDKFTVIRSICHKDPNHGGGNHYMMTGAPTPVPVGCGAFVTFHPSFGSVVLWKRGIRNGLPAYMTTPDMTRSGGPNFLGARHSPFVIKGYPNSPDFKVRDVVLPPQITS